MNITVILIIFEGQFQVRRRFSSGKLVLKTVESCFVPLNYYENGRNKHEYYHTAHPRIIDVSYHDFKRFSSSKLVLKTVES